MKITKEQFNQFWKDSKRKNILNQYYYDYMYMQKLKEDINKAIEFVSKVNGVMGERHKIILLEILKGDEEDND